MATSVFRLLARNPRLSSCYAKRQKVHAYTRTRERCRMISTARDYQADATSHRVDDQSGVEEEWEDIEDASGRDAYDRLYQGHIPTSTFQKALLSAGAAAVAITRPWRGDMVACLGETTGHFALMRMRQKMMADPVGRQILEERPTIKSHTVDLDKLRRLPEGTFGKVYVTWLDDNRASPDERLPVHFVDDPDLAYVMQRYREVHDLFHTVLGMPTNMLGEVVVKWVEALQTGLPMCAMGAVFGPVRLGPRHMQKYMETHLWWALRNGYRAKFLMNVYYEKHWDWSLDELRAELNLEPPPATPPKLRK